MLLSLARAAQRANANVWAIDGPRYPVDGVDPAKFKYLDLWVNTVWVRDFGPVGLIQNGKVAILDTTVQKYKMRRDDDEIPSHIAGLHSFPSYNVPLILDGGN